MPWPKKHDKIIFENGKPRRIIYTSPFAPRCPVCRRDTDELGRSGSGYRSCINPRCTVNGFKIDDEGKILDLWLGKPLDYRRKKEEPKGSETVSLDDIVWDFDHEKWREETLQTWGKQHAQYKKREKKYLVERRAEWKLRGWRPEEGER